MGNRVVPHMVASNAMSLWTLILHPQEAGQCSKNGCWDETLQLGDVARSAWILAVVAQACLWWMLQGLLNIAIANFSACHSAAKGKAALAALGANLSCVL